MNWFNSEKLKDKKELDKGKEKIIKEIKGNSTLSQIISGKPLPSSPVSVASVKSKVGNLK